jgi:hypothetical protein
MEKSQWLLIETAIFISLSVDSGFSLRLRNLPRAAQTKVRAIILPEFGARFAGISGASRILNCVANRFKPRLPFGRRLRRGRRERSLLLAVLIRRELTFQCDDLWLTVQRRFWPRSNHMPPKSALRSNKSNPTTCPLKRPKWDNLQFPMRLRLPRLP